VGKHWFDTSGGTPAGELGLSFLSETAKPGYIFLFGTSNFAFKKNAPQTGGKQGTL
jgi:hypothetical protein